MTIFGPLVCATTSPDTVTSASASAAEVTDGPSTSSTAGRVTAAPGSPAIFSTSMTSPSATLYCLPPVLTIAYIRRAFLPHVVPCRVRPRERRPDSGLTFGSSLLGRGNQGSTKHAAAQRADRPAYAARSAGANREQPGRAGLRGVQDCAGTVTTAAPPPSVPAEGPAGREAARRAGRSWGSPSPATSSATRWPAVG